MNRFHVIDADGHVMETHPKVLDWAQRIPEPYRERGPKHVPFRTGGGRTWDVLLCRHHP